MDNTQQQPANLGTQEQVQQQPQQSFRDRKAAELRAEKGADAEPALELTQPESREHVRGLEIEDVPSKPEQDAGEDTEVVEDELHDQTEEELDEAEGADDLEPGDDVDPDADQEDDETEDPVIVELRQQVEQAEEARASMEKDYRHKTRKIAESRREMETNLENVEAIANWQLQLAHQGVQQFEQVNWQDLQTRPEEYQQMRMAFQQATQQRDQMLQAMQNIQAQAKEMRDKALQQEADISRDILKSTVQGWGPDRYRDLREFASENLHFTGEEIDQMTDWRIINMMNALMGYQKQTGSVKQVSSKKQGKAPAGGRNKPHPKRRNAKGRFQSAKQQAHSEPGNRGSFREMMEAKLKAEREGQS